MFNKAKDLLSCLGHLVIIYSQLQKSKIPYLYWRRKIKINTARSADRLGQAHTSAHWPSHARSAGLFESSKQADLGVATAKLSQ